MASKVLSIRELSRQYGDQLVVDGVSLDVMEGETLALVGASGSGKTTLLKMINRLVEPSSGQVFVDGRDASNLSVEDLRRSIGYVIQSAGLLPHLTVARNVSLVPRLLGWKENRIRARVAELLELVGLPVETFGQRGPNTLSGGQRQRVGIARALAADPPLVLLDEPFGALDPVTRRQITEEFQRLEALIHKTMILVTHDIQEAIQLGDRIAVLEQGRLLQVGTAAQLTFHPACEQVRDLFGPGAERWLWQTRSIESLMAWLPEDPRIAGKDRSEVCILPRNGRLIEILDQSARSNPSLYCLEGEEKIFDLQALFEAWKAYRKEGELPHPKEMK